MRDKEGLPSADYKLSVELEPTTGCKDVVSTVLDLICSTGVELDKGTKIGRVVVTEKGL